MTSAPISVTIPEPFHVTRSCAGPVYARPTRNVINFAMCWHCDSTNNIHIGCCKASDLIHHLVMHSVPSVTAEWERIAWKKVTHIAFFNSTGQQQMPVIRFMDASRLFHYWFRVIYFDNNLTLWWNQDTDNKFLIYSSTLRGKQWYIYDTASR